jgi:fatty acid desaturase
MQIPTNHLTNKRTIIWNSLAAKAKQPPTWPELMRLGLMQWFWISIYCFAMLLYVQLASPTLRNWDWLAYGFIAIALAGKYHALGVVLHDACHLPKILPSRERLILEIFCGFPIATTLRAMRFHHLRHHQASCLASDPYFKPQSSRTVWAIWLRLRGLLIVPFWIARSLLGTLVIFYKSPRLLNIYRVVFLQDKNAFVERSSAEALACAKDDIGQVLFFIFLGFATFLWPMALALLYWVPVSIAGLLNAYRVIEEHRHIERADNSVESLLATTVTHKLWWPLQTVLYPLSIGYHEVHHLFPTLKLQSLKEANELLKARS